MSIRNPAAITFSVPLPPRALRVNAQTHNTAWRARLVREYQEQVWCAFHAVDALHAAYVGSDVPWRALPWPYARLRLTWCHAGVAPDADNALGACKALIDVLHTRSRRPLGIVENDDPAHLLIERVELVKVAHRREECVIVRIEWMESAG